MTISTRDACPVAISRGATYRAQVDVCAASSQPLDSARLLLTADVVRRVVEDHCAGQMWLAVVADRVDANSPVRHCSRALGVREPAVWVNTPDRAQLALNGPPQIVVQPADQPVAAMTSRPAVLGVGSATTPRQSSVGLFEDFEATVIRLALLRFTWRDPASLSNARLQRAEQTLERWRGKVADWADMPAAPMSARVVDGIRTALASDFDTATALMLLHRLETDLAVESGSKFETFMYADRVLGLDLAHLVGRFRR